MLVDQELDNKASSHKLHNPKPVVGKGSFKSNGHRYNIELKWGAILLFPTFLHQK